MKKNFYPIFILGILAASSLTAQIDQIGRWADGPCTAIAVQGDYVYYQNGGYVVVADISDPTQPVKMDSILLQQDPHEMAIHGSYLYVTGYYGSLTAIDISSATAPFEVVTVPINDKYINDVAVGDGFVYTTGDMGLHIFNVSDPMVPELDTTIVGDFREIEIRDSLLFAIPAFSFSARLYIYNISDPKAPVEIASGAAPEAATLTYTNGFAYVGQYSARGISAFQVNDGGTILSSANLPIPIYLNTDIKADSSYIYFMGGENMVAIVDVSDINNMEEISTIYTFGYSNFGALQGNNLYLAQEGGGMRVFDVSDATNPLDVGGLATKDINWGNLVVKDNSVFFPMQRQGLQVLDISNPHAPTVKGHLKPNDCFGTFTHDCVMEHVAVGGNHAYLSSRSELFIIDVTDEFLPEIVLVLTTYDPIKTIVQDSILYLLDNHFGLYTLNIKEPSNPIQMDGYAVSGAYSDFEILGDLAFLIENGKLHVLDISDPNDIATITVKIIPATYTHEIEVNDSFAFISSFGGTIDIYDISNPALNIEIASAWPIVDVFYDNIFLFGDQLFINLVGGFQVINISDVENIYEECRFDGGLSLFSGLYVTGDTIYGLEWENGFHVFTKTPTATSEPADLSILPFRLNSIYPNPFHLQTTIGYTLSKKGNVELSIFDISGKKVETLFKGEQVQGEYEIHWEAKDGGVSGGGIFFCQLNVDGQVVSQKMVKLPD